MSASRKQTAVRMLEKAILKTLRNDETGMSGLQSGRLAVQLRRHVPRLKSLLRDDPDKKFWSELQKAILDTVKYLHRV